MTILWLALLVGVSITSVLYLLLDALIGEGRVDARMQQRLEGLLVHRSNSSIVKDTSFSSIARLQKVLNRNSFSKNVQQLLILSGWNMPLSIFILSDVLWAFIVFAIVNAVVKIFLIAVGAAAVMSGIPYIFLVFNKRRYIDKFTVFFPDSLMMMKSALKAGQGLQSAFQVVADEGPKPVSTEFSRLVKEIELGAPVSEALNELYQRILTLDLRLFVLGIHIQHEVGGNLVELFEHIEHTIRERLSLGREMRVLAAQGKMTGVVLMLLPIGLAGVIGVANPGFFQPLLTDVMGRKLVWGAIAMQFIGSFVIHRMTYFKPIF